MKKTKVLEITIALVTLTVVAVLMLLFVFGVGDGEEIARLMIDGGNGSRYSYIFRVYESGKVEVIYGPNISVLFDEFEEPEYEVYGTHIKKLLMGSQKDKVLDMIKNAKKDGRLISERMGYVTDVRKMTVVIKNERYFSYYNHIVGNPNSLQILAFELVKTCVPWYVKIEDYSLVGYVKEWF